MSDSASRLFEPLPDLELAPLFCAKALESPEKRDESSKSSSSITTLIKGAFKDARKDIKSIPRPFSSSSRRFWARFGIVIWFASLFTLLSFLSFWMSLGLESPCEADGDFNIELDSEMGGFKYRGDLWAIKGFFEVTLGWGKLSFTAAKLIDVTWDLVIGRGCQAVMSLIAWRVYTEYLEVSIAIRPATYKTVWLMRFYQDTSLLSSMHLFVEFFRHGLASKAATWIMAMTLSFILAFPTIAGSMTGYTALNNAYITTSGNRLFPFDSVKPVAYVIHDGGRTADLTDNYIVPWVSGILTIQCHGSADVQQYGFNAPDNKTAGNRNKSTTFRGEALHWPPLNISAYFLPDRFYWSSASIDEVTVGNNPYGDSKNILFLVDKDMYNSTELKSNGICQPIKDKVRSSSITIHRANKTQNSVQKYQWGFSFLQLYVVVILLALWSIGMGVLWKVSHDMLESNHREVASGNWKGLLDLAETIRMQVKDAGIDIDNLSDQQLEDEIQSVLHGGSVSSQHMPTNSFSISCWLWKSKWPIIVGILATVLMATEHALRPYSFGLYGFSRCWEYAEAKFGTP
ncbi:hypothetical protein SNK03_003875 [Fusarium graminearum]